MLLYVNFHFNEKFAFMTKNGYVKQVCLFRLAVANRKPLLAGVVMHSFECTSNLQKYNTQLFTSVLLILLKAFKHLALVLGHFQLVNANKMVRRIVNDKTYAPVFLTSNGWHAYCSVGSLNSWASFISRLTAITI